MVEENLVGKKLGDYILREKLTSGGMAEIYLGDDEKLKRRAAIKILSLDHAGDSNMLRDRFEREARAVAQLEHDSIVPIYQFGEDDHLYFIAMRYIEGNDLADEMKQYKERGDKMPVDRMLTILTQVAGALDHAHKRGIIHRDVKPSNILLRRQSAEEDKAVLTDFGLVLWEDVDKTLGTAFGTPRYISPEQATDSQSAVPQSDVYSLAVIVYEILTGEVLFTGNTPMEVALSHITEPPRPPRAHNPDIPADAQREILKALQKDANKRHTTAMNFINALKEAYDLHDTGTKPPSMKPDVSTKPLREETPDLDSWQRVPPATLADHELDQAVKRSPLPEAVRADQPQLDSVPDTERGGIPISTITGVVVVIALAIALASGVLSGTGNFGGVINPVNANMELRYNEDFLAVVNISENATLNISGMRLVGATGVSGQNFGTQLAPGECRFVRRGATQDGGIPDDWGCDGTALRVESNADLYWRAEEISDDHFIVQNDSNSVRECPTAGRVVNNAGNNSCSVEWPQYTTEE
ncbi:MAG: serine/threonine protein kinase [Anaerolineae bacterium]